MSWSLKQAWPELSLRYVSDDPTNLHLFQLYHGGQFYLWRKAEYPKKITDLPQVTDKRFIT